MMEQVKIMVDEQTKLTLKQLQDSLSVLLAPLEKLNVPPAGAAGGEVAAKVADDVRRLSRDLEDGFADVSRKIGNVLTAQEDLFARLAAVAKRQDEMAAVVQSLSVPNNVIAVEEETIMQKNAPVKKCVHSKSMKVTKKKESALMRTVKKVTKSASKDGKAKKMKNRK